MCVDASRILCLLLLYTSSCIGELGSHGQDATKLCVITLKSEQGLLLMMQALVKMCAGASLAAALPSMIHQVLSPSPRGLLLGLANSALAFFLFSYQVKPLDIHVSPLVHAWWHTSSSQMCMWSMLIGHQTVHQKHHGSRHPSLRYLPKQIALYEIAGACFCLGQLLGTEAPIMTPNGVDFSLLFFLFSDLHADMSWVCAGA